MMLGALHIEDKIHQMTGKLLRDSGGTTVLSQAMVLPSGRAKSALNEHHIKRTRYAHQLSVMYLHPLKHKAYPAYSYAVHGTAESQQACEQLSSSSSIGLSSRSLSCWCVASFGLYVRDTSHCMSKYVMSSVHGFV